jgi:hypothetical protein
LCSEGEIRAEGGGRGGGVSGSHEAVHVVAQLDEQIPNEVPGPDCLLTNRLPHVAQSISHVSDEVIKVVGRAINLGRATNV